MDPNFCKQVGMPMVGIHTRFERFRTPYASCDTSSHLSPFLTGKTPEKAKFVENQNTLFLELGIQANKKNMNI